MSPADVRARPALLLEGATVLRGGAAILDAVDLALSTQRTVVIGPNGAGKTTLLQAIHGLVELAAGRVVEIGTDGARARVRCGLVFQRPVMLRRSARANVEHVLAVAGVPAARRRERAEAALAEVGLGHSAERPAPKLSGGEQQRLAIARAEALAPDFLLLDEPTASLDPGASAAIERYLRALSARGRGVVMSTHDLGFARRFAEQVVFMHRGRVVETGPAAAFFGGPRSEPARRFVDGEWLD